MNRRLSDNVAATVRLKTASVPSAELPLATTRAAAMVAKGLRALADRDGVSLRELAKRLGHKQPVMLSHWATGRAPIPVERVAELADALRLDERSLLLAVLQQRHPSVHWDALEDEHTPAFHFVRELENIARGPVEEFTDEQVHVMREAAADPRASRRWLSYREVATIELIRELRPASAEVGLDREDLASIRAALATGHRS